VNEKHGARGGVYALVTGSRSYYTAITLADMEERAAGSPSLLRVKTLACAAESSDKVVYVAEIGLQA
jgi:hypothetical protein